MDALLHDQDPEIQEIARQARQLILRLQPDAHEQLETSWGGYLLFKQLAEAGNTVCWLSVHARHVSLGFAEGTALQDPAGLLEGSGKRQRHVKLKNLARLELPELAALVVQAWQRQPAPAALERALEEVRRICLSLPETSEKLSHGHPTFFAGKRSFAVYGLYSPSLAFKPEPGRALQLAGDERFFPTPYMAQNGWISLRLDEQTDWSEVEELLSGSFLQVATRKLRLALESR